MLSKPLLQFDFNSPIGVVRITGDDELIHGIEFLDSDNCTAKSESPAIEKCIRQLDEYCSGSRKEFSVPVKLDGSDFQKRIWNLLMKIPYGQTISYLELAVRAGNRNVIRAAGHANGANKLPIIIPCHRVIGSNGNLIGYAGGLWRKEWLLRLERNESQPELFAEAQFFK